MPYYGLPQVLNEAFLPSPHTSFTLNSVPASVPLQSFVLQMDIAVLQEERIALIEHGSAPKLSVIPQHLKGQATGQKQSHEYVHISFTAFLN